MTTPTRPACLELVLALLGDPEAARLRSYIEALEARAALAQPEPIRDRIAQAEAAIEASMERIRAIAAPARTALAQPEPAAPTDEELIRVYQAAYGPAWERGEHYGAHIDGLRAVLARWGSPALVQREPEFTAEEVEMIQAPWSYLAPAQPEAEGPTDEERFATFAQWLAREMPPNTVISDPLWWAPRIARAVLRHMAHPTPQPIPVSERLPEAGDCDAEGQIWAWYCDDPDVEYEGNFWTPLYLRLVTASHNVTHWLPASALPIPQHPQPDPTA